MMSSLPHRAGLLERMPVLTVKLSSSEGGPQENGEMTVEEKTVSVPQVVCLSVCLSVCLCVCNAPLCIVCLCVSCASTCTCSTDQGMSN